MNVHMSILNMTILLLKHNFVFSGPIWIIFFSLSLKFDWDSKSDIVTSPNDCNSFDLRPQCMKIVIKCKKNTIPWWGSCFERNILVETYVIVFPCWVRNSWKRVFFWYLYFNRKCTRSQFFNANGERWKLVRRFKRSHWTYMFIAT